MLEGREDMSALATALEAAAVGRVRRGVSTASLTTWRLGGPADLLVEPDSVEALCRARAVLARWGGPVVVVGDGSNLLVCDEGVRGVVLRIGRAMGRVAVQGRHVRAGAGAGVPATVRRLGLAGLGGAEKLIGVPGTLGGLVVMNGGCFGQCIGDVLTRVTAVDPVGRAVVLDAAACELGYRHSAFQGRLAGWVVAEVELAMGQGDPAALRAEMLEILRERRRRFPRYRLQPNCGSVFKSSPAMYERFGPPGRVIEETGCKGWREGGAIVSTQHANFVLAGPDATARDVLGLIGRVRRAVLDRTGIGLECEVRFVGADGRIVPAHEAAGERA